MFLKIVVEDNLGHTSFGCVSSYGDQRRSKNVSCVYAIYHPWSDDIPTEC